MSLVRIACSLLLLLMLSPLSRAQTDPVNLTAIFFDEAQPGFGVNVTHQGSVLFVAWYTYNSNGEVQWLTMGATRQEDGSYSGSIDTFTGLPFNTINGSQAFTGVQPAGQGRITLREDGRIDFNYTVNGITQTKALQRFDFAEKPPVCGFTTGSRAGATNYTDIWWNSSESGWGLTLIHQGDTIFAAWFTYGADNQSQWIVGSALVKQEDGSFLGELSRPESGTPFNQINGPATTFPIPTVGSARLTFSNGENVRFDYTLDGITQTKNLSRFVFVEPGQPVSVCNESDGGTDPSPAAECDPGLTVGDEYSYRRSSPTGNEEFLQRVVGPGTFQGQAVIVSEQRDANNALLARLYNQINDEELIFLGQEQFQNGGLSSTSVLTPPQRFRRNAPVGTSYTLNYRVDTTTGGQTTSVNTAETITRVANESRTVPAGTFNSCKFTRSIQSTTMGFSTTNNLTEWLSPLVGPVTSSITVQTPFGGINSELNLLRAKVLGIEYP